MKELSDKVALRDAPVPERVFIPLSQHIGAPAKVVVNKGDTVKMGQKIGELSAFVSCNIHSSVSGQVFKIEKMLDALGRYVDHVIIDNDGKDTKEYLPEHENPLELTAQEIKTIAGEAGLAGMGGATFPTFVKISPPDNKPVDTIILNGAECEPYLTSDHRLMLEMAEDVIIGGLLFMKAMNASKLYIGIEKNKPDAIEMMKKFAPKYDNVEIAELITKYPQGAEKQLIDAVAKKEVPSGGLPFDTGCSVQNVGTAKALYDAVRFGKPLIDRVVTITGTIVTNPVNVIARIGTPYSFLLDAAGGTKEEAGKVISGGPMMGLAQKNLDVVVTKGTSGILFFPRSQSLRRTEQPCISCGKCVEICPMRLMPTVIAQNSRLERWDIAEKNNALDCIECGSCSWICCAAQPLLDRIRRAKSEIQLIKRKGKK